ncbi:recombinase family protein [Nonomuraea sp. NPDC049784]|uniref:recombinase family protein n=1 Tax=Nonomuraea sp. NPDC049784 TaxID=3154361 RepID=UPI0033DCE34A
MGQSPAPQITALINAGVPDENIRVERANGSKAIWPERDLMLKGLRRGDTLKIARLDRLFYSIQNLVVLGTELTNRGIRLQVIEQNIDSESFEGRDLFGMLSALAELQRDFVSATTNDGLAKARARDRTGGRKPALTDQQVTQAVKLHTDGTPVADIAVQAQSLTHHPLPLLQPRPQRRNDPRRQHRLRRLLESTPR